MKSKYYRYVCISVRRLVRAWAPLVWLAPGEEFLPLGVPQFLENVEMGKNFDYLSTRLDVGNQDQLVELGLMIA